MRKFIVFMLLSITTAGYAQTVNVRYEVKSKGKYDITYSNASGGTEQTQNYGSWSKSFTTINGSFLYLSAQASEPNATIEVSIYNNDSPVKTSKSTGDYVVASVDFSANASITSTLLNNDEKGNMHGEQCAFSFSPILDMPSTDGKKVGEVKGGKVMVIDKANDQYYHVKSGDTDGYLAVGWFKKCN